MSRPPSPAPLAVTMGDPAGIGPELIVRAWRSLAASGRAVFAAYGDPELFRQRARAIGQAVDVVAISEAAQARDVFARALPVLEIALAAPSVAGSPDPANAAAVIAAIDRAVRDAMSGAASAVVTAPIAKNVLYAAGFRHPGHTEYLAALAGEIAGTPPPEPVMLLAGGGLRVVPLTIHVPLAQVSRLIDGSLIERTTAILHAALVRDFGIAKPRIVIAGLNPHAGESGTIGREDEDVVAPAVARLRARGLDVSGPRSADTLFHPAARAGYDAVVAMYHDQALIPVKTLAFDEGVNITLGLPFVRTSPDHGTAFDIAGTGRANPASLLAAIALAEEIAARRAAAAS